MTFKDRTKYVSIFICCAELRYHKCVLTLRAANHIFALFYNDVIIYTLQLNVPLR